MYSLTKATEIFTKHYEIGNQNISNEVLKYNTHKLRHSIGVLETGRNLIIKMKENMSISPETINRAEIVLFLHDLGRFYQNNKECVLSNSECEHGDIGAEMAKQEGYDDKIFLAIKHHNKYSLDDFYKEKLYQEMTDEDKTETEFLAKFIRDADKLQNMIYTIFNIGHFLKIDIYGQGLKREDISKINLTNIQNKKQINRKNIVSFGDYLLSSLCWVFDINFKESLDMLDYYGYFEKILKEFEKVEEISRNSLDIIKENVLNYKINLGKKYM